MVVAVKITIDNLDGQGALDYSEWISTRGRLKMQRRLNAPSVCACRLDLGAGRCCRCGGARVVVTLDERAVLFTGYVATEPELIYAGCGDDGPVPRCRARDQR